MERGRRHFRHERPNEFTTKNGETKELEDATMHTVRVYKTNKTKINKSKKSKKKINRIRINRIKKNKISKINKISTLQILRLRPMHRRQAPKVQALSPTTSLAKLPRSATPKWTPRSVWHCAKQPIKW